MLFHVSWEFISPSEESQHRSLAVLSKWQPPAGADFKAFYAFAGGNGGFAVVEVDSAATLARTTAPWAPWLRFTVNPILSNEENAAIAAEAMSWRDSVA